MRKFLPLLALLFLAPSLRAASCSNTGLGGGIVCVISHSTETSTATTTVVFTTGHTATNILVVFAAANSAVAWSAAPATNISNTLAYTWLVAKGDCPNGSQRSTIWYAVVPTTSASSDTITVTNSGSTFTSVNAMEITDLASLDGTGACGTTTSGSYTVTVNDLNLGGCNGGGSGVGAPTGWVLRSTSTHTGIITQIASSTTASFTCTGTVTETIGIAFIPTTFSGSNSQVGAFLPGP